ncbi:unnamed protein product [Linum trigynum]|uniref:Uncharacterized protein n=1 Tax=Linum trigynum TaxID=586398 RepID=A0AAV2FAY0_9ROSI
MDLGFKPKDKWFNETDGLGPKGNVGPAGPKGVAKSTGPAQLLLWSPKAGPGPTNPKGADIPVGPDSPSPPSRAITTGRIHPRVGVSSATETSSRAITSSAAGGDIAQLSGRRTTDLTGGDRTLPSSGHSPITPKTEEEQILPKARSEAAPCLLDFVTSLVSGESDQHRSLVDSRFDFCLWVL